MTTYFSRGRIISTIAVAASVAVLTGLLGFFFYAQGRNIMAQHIKNHLRTTAAIGAQQFAGEELDTVDDKEDMDELLFVDMVYRLRAIREADENIEYAYLMRRTDDPDFLEFIVDADVLDPFEMQDANENGVIDDSEANSYPGDLYDISEVPAMQEDAFIHPTTDEEFTEDQWGTLISGYAPIFRSNGTVAGIIGLDMRAADFNVVATSLFSPVILLFVMVLALLIAAYVFYLLWRRRVTSFRLIERERSSMLQLMMHQIGSPLTIFKWFTEELQECRTLECNGMVLGDYLDGLQDGIEMLDTVFQGLVQADKLHTRSLRFEPKHTTLNEIIHTVRKDVEPKMARRKQILELDMGSDVPLVIDPRLLEGMLKELLMNASVFSPEGSMVTLRTEARGKTVQLQVIDEGCGIAENELPRVFEKFFRGSNAARYRPSGNGLGLFVVKKVLDQLNGHISMKSTEGKGTTVTVELNLK